MDHCAQRNTIDSIVNDSAVFHSHHNYSPHYNYNYFQEMDGQDIQALLNDEVNDATWDQHIDNYVENIKENDAVEFEYVIT